MESVICFGTFLRIQCNNNSQWPRFTLSSKTAIIYSYISFYFSTIFTRCDSLNRTTHMQVRRRENRVWIQHWLHSKRPHCREHREYQTVTVIQSHQNRHVPRQSTKNIRPVWRTSTDRRPKHVRWHWIQLRLSSPNTNRNNWHRLHLDANQVNKAIVKATIRAVRDPPNGTIK